jgi:hypothetical protein
MNLNNLTTAGVQNMSQLDPHNLMLVSSNKEADPSQLNTLRKSMPGSSSGLKQL